MSHSSFCLVLCNDDFIVCVAASQIKPALGKKLLYICCRVLVLLVSSHDSLLNSFLM